MTSFMALSLMTNSLFGSVQFLLDLALKSTVLLLMAWVLAASLRNASAAIRHWVLSAAIVGVLALPILSLMLPSWRLDILPALSSELTASLEANAIASAPVLPATSTASIPEESTGQFLTITPVETTRTPRFEIESDGIVPSKPQKAAWPTIVPSFIWSLNWGMAVLGFWGLGALLIVARLLAGIYRVLTLANQAKPITESVWTSLAGILAARLGIRSRVGLLQSKQIEIPMTVGAWRSIVMLPADADQWSQQCRNVVLLHELAHVKRRDCLIQNLAQLACAFYWFNPLVWMTAKRLRVERELACDDRVLEAGTKATDYANHLVDIARAFKSNGYDGAGSMQPYSPAVGMACSQLESRVRSILDPGVKRSGLNRLSVFSASLGAACLVLSLAALQPRKTAACLPTDSPNALKSQIKENSVLPTETAEAPKIEAKLAVNHTETAGKLSVEQEHPEQEAPESEVSLSAQQNDQTKVPSSELTADQLIQMKVHGITPEFIESMRKAGLENLTVQQLTSLRVHGIETDFISQARSWNGGQVSVNELLQLKVSGVTPEYIAAMKRAGYDGLKLHQLSAMRIHGVTPVFVETMRKAGYDKLTADQLTSLRVHGIDEKYADEIQRWTGSKASINELMEIKIHGVSPEYARSLKALGYDNLPVNKLTQMKIHGVTEQFIKEMASLGFDKLTAEQLVQMRIHGITADYVKKMRAAGLKNVSVNQMIEMKIHGIDSILLKEKR